MLESGKKSLKLKRFIIGLNAVGSVLLALVILLMVNYISKDYFHYRWDISSGSFYGLSGTTKNLLGGIEGDVRVIVFLKSDHVFATELNYLLKEYRYEADKHPMLNLEIEIIDPNRELSRAEELGNKYRISKMNVMVFECAGREKRVDLTEMIDYEIDYSQVMTTRKIMKNRSGFKGEQVISSGIQNVVQETTPIAYFLTGHGERQITDFNEINGYSSIVQMMRYANIEVKSLSLARERGVPEDCSVLVIAGPDRIISPMERDYLSAYLNKNGRIMLMLDAMAATGLDKLLGDWGVKIATDVVVDPSQTLTGRELFVTGYGKHPITEKMKNAAVMFYDCRSLMPIDGEADASAEIEADKPRVSILAACTKQGWAEVDMVTNPMSFDKGVDVAGPVSVAVAVEKGFVKGIDVELKPTRMVIIGDSYFAGNGGLNGSVGGNQDFFMSSINWLVERESLIGIAPRAIVKPKLDMNQHAINRAFLLVMLPVPLLVALIGFGIWWWRRR